MPTDDDWCRKISWSDDDRDAFFKRLSRCRSQSTRTQGLRIQAGTLANMGLNEEAIELLDLLLCEHPTDYFRGMTYSARADCYQSLGQTTKAVADYRRALALEKDECSNIHTNAWLDFPLLVVRQEISDLYDEALQAIEFGESQQSLIFPMTIYACEAVRAIVSKACGDLASAADHARAAIEAAAQGHSGVSQHPLAGLVSKEDRNSSLYFRLTEIDGEWC